MLWLVTKQASYEIKSCNIFDDTTTGKHQLWITRSNGKSANIYEDTDESKVLEIKEAIDYAIEQKEPVLRLE